MAQGCATEVNVFGACDVVAQRSMGMLSAHRSEDGGGGGVGSGGKQNSSARDRPPSGLSAFGHWLCCLRGHDSYCLIFPDFTLSVAVNEGEGWAVV